MSFVPKTPSRRPRADAKTKTPLTPSLTAGLNSMSLASSPTKPLRRKKSTKSLYADTSNPFLAQPSIKKRASAVSLSLSKSTSHIGSSKSRSRPNSPIKLNSDGVFKASEEMQREASGGIVKRGGIESKFDVIVHDYVPPRIEMKRSKSQPAVMKV